MHAEIQLAAYVAVEKPDTSYQATLEMNGTWYALVPFETTTSYVRVTGGQPNGSVNVVWTIQTGYGVSNDMAVAASASGDSPLGNIVSLNAQGEWQVQPALYGSLDVAVGQRYAITIAEVRIPNTSSGTQATAARSFGVVAPQGGGGGGGQ